MAAVMAHDCGVAKLAGESVVAIDHLTVDDDSAANSCSKGDHDEILHSPCGAVGHLTHGGGVGVVGKGHRDSSHRLGKHLRERYRPGASPRKIHRILNLSGVVVGVRGADSDSTDLAFSVGVSDDLLQRSRKFLNVRLDGRVGVRTDDGLSKHGSTRVHHSTFGGLPTDIYSYY